MEVKGLNMVRSQGVSKVKAEKACGDEFNRILDKVASLKDLANLDDTSESVSEETDEYGEEENLSLHLFIPSGIQINRDQSMDIRQIQDILGMEDSLDLEVSTSISINTDDLDPNIENNLSLAETAIYEHKIASGMALDDKQLSMEASKDFVNNDLISDYFASKEVDNEGLLDNDTTGINYLDRDTISEGIAKNPIINEVNNLNPDSNEGISFNSLNETMSTDKIAANEQLSDENSLNLNSETKEEEVMNKPKNNDIGFAAHLESSTSVERMSNGVTNSSLESILPSEIDFGENVQRVSDTLMDMIDLNVGDKGESMRVKLYPEELGHIDLILKMEDGKLVAKILVASEQVREMFNSQLNQLSQKLISQDINVERLDVDLNFNSYNESGTNNQQSPRKNFLGNYQNLALLENSHNIMTNEDYILGSSGVSILA